MVMVKSPVVFLPFIFIAFFEVLAAELIYFSARKPILLFAGPIIRKFFGEAALHYPSNLMILPKLFYYGQIVIYIFLGVFLTAISVNIFNSVKSDAPLKAKALLKNAAKNYFYFVIYGIIIVALITLLRRIDVLAFTKAMHLFMKIVPRISSQVSYFGLMMFLFLTNVILQTFMILVVPLMVIEKKALLKAVFESLYIGFRNFFTVFKIIFLPFIAYLPITLLKGMSTPLADKTFPEMNFIVVLISSVASIFVDSFIILCVSQFLLDKAKGVGLKKA